MNKDNSHPEIGNLVKAVYLHNEMTFTCIGVLVHEDISKYYISLNTYLADNKSIDGIEVLKKSVIRISKYDGEVIKYIYSYPQAEVN